MSKINRKKGQSLKLKIDCLIHYSGNPPKCACCGEQNIGFLTIDHISGGGNLHRKSISGSIYRWLKTREYPTGFQVLCMNCNWGRSKNNGICPHAGSDDDSRIAIVFHNYAQFPIGDFKLPSKEVLKRCSSCNYIAIEYPVEYSTDVCPKCKTKNWEYCSEDEAREILKLKKVKKNGT